ncbi:MAG: hypothetical protein AAF353_00020 [Pseudomonadota bacterium]
MKVHQLIRTLLICFLAAFPKSGVSWWDGGVSFDESPQSFRLLGQLPALCQISFKYTPIDGSITQDAHVQTLKVIPDPASDFLEFDLSDKDRGEHNFGNRTLWKDQAGFLSLRADPPLPAFIQFAETSRPCRGSCWIPIPPTRQTFLLAGLYFSFTEDDHHLHRVSLIPQAAEGRVLVRLTDNSNDRPFTARIAYIIRSPGYHFGEFQSFSTTNELDAIDRHRINGDAFIQGFDVWFTNGDHHLQDLTIDVCSMDGRIKGTFRDKDGEDDPFRMNIYYAIYQPID